MRRPKFRGHVDLTDSIKSCPKCVHMMFKELKADFTGKEWRCKCGYVEDV